MYVGMSADIVHHGHVNIISVAKNLGRVVVGLLTDEGAPALRCTKALMPALLTDKSWLAFCDAAAIESYKRKTVVPWENRKRLIEAIKGVDLVVPQTTLDYAPNLKWLRPAFVVHGSDWADPKGPQYAARQKVIDTLAEWQGQLIEPPYTGGISTTEIIKVSLAAWNLAPPALLTGRALVCVCCADRCRTRCVAAFKLTAKGACLSLPPSGAFSAHALHAALVNGSVCLRAPQCENSAPPLTQLSRSEATDERPNKFVMAHAWHYCISMNCMKCLARHCLAHSVHTTATARMAASASV